MNKHLESLPVGEMIAITDTNLFEVLLYGMIKSKLIVVWLSFEWKTVSLVSLHGINTT